MKHSPVISECVLLAAEKALNEEDISEPFARERRKVSGDHSVLKRN